MNKVTRTHIRVNAQYKFKKNKSSLPTAITSVQQCTHRSVIQIDKRWKDFFLLRYGNLVSFDCNIKIMANLFNAVHNSFHAKHICQSLLLLFSKVSKKNEQKRKEKKRKSHWKCVASCKSQFSIELCALFSLSLPLRSDTTQFTIVIIDFFYHSMKRKKINFLKLVAKPTQKKTWNFVKYGISSEFKVHALDVYTLLFAANVEFLFLLFRYEYSISRSIFLIIAYKSFFFCVCSPDLVLQIEPCDNRSPHLR